MGRSGQVESPCMLVSSSSPTACWDPPPSLDLLVPPLLVPPLLVSSSNSPADFSPVSSSRTILTHFFLQTRTHNCPTLSYLPAQDTFCPTDPLCPMQDTLILLSSSRIVKKFGFQIFKYVLQMSTSMTTKFAAE